MGIGSGFKHFVVFGLLVVSGGGVVHGHLKWVRSFCCLWVIVRQWRWCM
jgi:hypothetical protein